MQRDHEMGQCMITMIIKKIKKGRRKDRGLEHYEVKETREWKRLKLEW